VRGMNDEPTTTGEEQGVDAEVLVEDVLVEDVLVEEVSIDGMCGVY
jgi:mycofactocin precursor peptide MftA